MELKDLNHDERLAFLGLLQAVVTADQAASPGEAENIREIVEQLGEEDYQRCLSEAEERFESLEDLQVFAAGIQNQESRELIYGSLLDTAIAGTVVGSENKLLEWLKSTWKIHTN